MPVAFIQQWVEEEQSFRRGSMGTHFNMAPGQGSGCRGSCQDRKVGAVKCGLCLAPRAPDVPVGPLVGI